MHIRPAQAEDFGEICTIYTHYVMHTTHTFEESPPTSQELIARWKESSEDNLPYLIAEDNDKILGYAYATLYRKRCAYRYSVEHSVYIAPDATQNHVGTALMNDIIHLCTLNEFKQMIAVIAGKDNTASIKFHEKIGFEYVGILRNVGYKFDQWIDTVLMQKSLD